MSDEVRKKVKKVIEEMNYTPNPSGRVLQKQGISYHIAVLLVEGILLGCENDRL